MLSKLKRCKVKGGRAYRIARLSTGADYTNEPRTVRIHSGYIP